MHIALNALSFSTGQKLSHGFNADLLRKSRSRPMLMNTNRICNGSRNANVSKARILSLAPT